MEPSKDERPVRSNGYSKESAFVGKNKSKIERYGWVQGGTSPGRLDWVSPHDLRIDRNYQRDVNEEKVQAIARSFDWALFGVATVASRDGVLFVVDGQHRVFGARRRADVEKVPVIIFDMVDSKEEARAFVGAQTLRKPVTILDQFRALIHAGDPVATFVDGLLRNHGRTAGGNSAKSVRCLGSLMSHAKANREVLQRMWPLLMMLAENEQLADKCFNGLMYIEARLPDGESLTDSRWRQRLLALGQPALVRASNEAAAFYAVGGERVWADGILRLLNRRLRNPLKLKSGSERRALPSAPESNS